MEHSQGQVGPHFVGQTAKLNQLNQAQWLCGEFSDGEVAAPLGNIVAKDQVNPRAVGQYCVNDWRAVGDRLANLLGQLDNEGVQIIMVLEADVGFDAFKYLVFQENSTQPAAANILDVGVLNQRLQDSHALFISNQLIAQRRELFLGDRQPFARFFLGFLPFPGQ